jgi:poly(3-hydroxybutyrate) depolymerase
MNIPSVQISPTDIWLMATEDTMPRHPFSPIDGELQTVTIHSQALQPNLLGDPAERQVAVYLPPSYHDTAADYPLMVDIVGFTDSGFAHVDWKAFQETVPQRLERLVRENKMGPVIVAFPDCFTSLGGNQYINSIAMGGWADFLTREMVPALEAKFRLRPGRQNRALFGKSSGGYGAIAHGMTRAEYWGAIAVHSGDMGFDRIFMGEFPKAVNLVNQYDGYEGFLRHLETANRVSSDEFMTLMILAMGATYDPDPHGPKGIRLPVDLHTCELQPQRWAAWEAHDPVRMIETPDCQASLRRLSGVYIDCGCRDQYNIHFGTRQLVRRLRDLGIDHVYEEFDDTHSGIDYRMDVSLPFLYHAMAK